MGCYMSIGDPPETIEEYLSRNPDLREIYRKTGYSQHFEERGQKLSNKIYALVKKHGEAIRDYSVLYGKVIEALNSTPDKKILRQLEASVPETPFHQFDSFQDELGKYKEGNPAGVSFIKEYFESLEKLERMYKSEFNPLPGPKKEEVLGYVMKLQEEFIEGGNTFEDTAFELKDRLDFIIDPLSLEEYFGNKKEEFYSVVNAILNLSDLKMKIKKKQGWSSADEEFVRNNLLKSAKLYIESPWMHCPVFTHELLRSIWTVTGLPLKRPPNDYVGYGSAIIYSLLMVGVVIYFFPDLNLLLGIGLASLLYYLFLKWKRVGKATQLNTMGSEISSEGYDSEEISRRLHRFETKGYTFPSIIYPLLRMKHKPSSNENI